MKRLHTQLQDYLPVTGGPVSGDDLLGRFLAYVEARRLRLYAAQEEAILEVFAGRNVILNTPTGSGKSLVAAAVHFRSVALGVPSVYTCPIKALVNEKWMDLCREFGPNRVGLSTGDATVNRGAPILCCTAEILANMALREGADCARREVVMDEFHYYSDRERGVAWQVPLLTLARARFLLMSATLGDTGFFEEELRRLTGVDTVTVRSSERPVPLEFEYVETPLAVTLERLVQEGKCPVYVVHFTQADAAQSAQDFTSINVCSREEKAALGAALEGVRFSSPYGPEVKRWLRHGIGLHHAGLLPRYRVLVERLAQRGLLKVICGTDTLGVGINVPIRTVLLTRLCKYDGEKTAILSARDFHQITGRAGRKGFDDLGWVVVQAPEHVVENLKLAEKAARDGRKVVKRKPPDKNYVAWDRNTFQRLVQAAPERLLSRFQVTHGMLLDVLGRDGDGCAAMRDLVRRCHETPAAKRAHTRRAWQLFRSLLDRRVIELPDGPSVEGRSVRLNVELQEDFSMDQTLSLYLIEALPLLDRDAEDYALNVITLVESILEDPEIILRRQLDKLKAERVAELKAEGVDYLQRMEELEKLEHPKPLRDFVYATFNEFAERHPWVGQENIRPKSVAREMFERLRTFSDYVRDYELQRAEGLLLRHLSSVYKVLGQTVPDGAKTDAVVELEEYLGVLIRQVDSSLMDEWERMQRPEGMAAVREEAEALPPGAHAADADVTRDERRFTAAIRARVFQFLVPWLGGRMAEALEALEDAQDGEAGLWDEARLQGVLDDYRRGHPGVVLGPEARNARHTHVRRLAGEGIWRVEQVLVDVEGLNDWVLDLEVNLAASRRARAPALRLRAVRPVSSLR